MGSYQSNLLCASVARPVLRPVLGALLNGTKKKEKSLNAIIVRTELIEGLEPACVTGCTTGALRWVSPAESSSIKREKLATKISQGTLIP